MRPIFRKNNKENYLPVFRYLLGVCSIFLCIFGLPFIIFMPPLWFVLPLFIYLIFLNFKQSKRVLDQFDLIQMSVWLIVFLPHECFIAITILFGLFVSYKIYKKQLIKCSLMIGFCIVYLITRDVFSIVILIALCLFSILHDIRFNQKISSTLPFK